MIPTSFLLLVNSPQFNNATEFFVAPKVTYGGSVFSARTTRKRKKNKTDHADSVSTIPAPIVFSSGIISFTAVAGSIRNKGCNLQGVLLGTDPLFTRGLSSIIL